MSRAKFSSLLKQEARQYFKKNHSLQTDSVSAFSVLKRSVLYYFVY